MKAILISDHAKWCALMMNGYKTIEIRKNKGLYKAIQKLIDEYGYADIYVYCSKDDDLGCIKKISKDKYVCGREFDIKDFNYLSSGYNGKGKVIFKFRCYKVEEIEPKVRLGLLSIYSVYETETLVINKLLEKCCLSYEELDLYLNLKTGYAIHISDLEIFDRPKELSEFSSRYSKADVKFQGIKGKMLAYKPLTKAPQNFCYVEVE